MKSNFYAPPDPVIRSPSLNPRETYAPILTPPVVPSTLLPGLPYGPREQSSLPANLSATHVLSTHLVTAAWPRTPSELFIESEHEPPANEGKQDRKARVKREHEYLSTKKRASERGEIEDVPKREEVLYSAFNRYRRKGPWAQGGLTVVVTHAVGFPKEIWEPTYAKIVEQTEASGIVRVNEIWAYEHPNHGDSAIINAGMLGVLAPWEDKSRDIIQFLLYYLPSNPSASTDLPLHLERLPGNVAEARRQRGFSGERTLVGLGHSAGATALVRAAIWEPKLFHSLVVLEPIIMTVEAGGSPIYPSWVAGAIGRRSKWSSREEAYNSYKASPSFSYWAPTVLETFFKYGIMEDKNSGPDAVKLKGPVFLEASTFEERVFPQETCEHLAALNKDIELRFIFSGKNNAATAGDVSTAHVAWRRPENTSNIRIPASHLMVQESPTEVSKAVVHFLQRKYSLTRARL